MQSIAVDFVLKILISCCSSSNIYPYVCKRETNTFLNHRKTINAIENGQHHVCGAFYAILKATFHGLCITDYGLDTYLVPSVVYIVVPLHLCCRNR